ncbi:MAG: NAD(P)-dependent oxidoreductase [Anaerolineaceae bacterium]|nr:NAD(P)-dependent oxidoreductase [Anaerolineaceae bacterium]
MASKRLGVIGLGDMGLAMARCLLTAGYPVTGYDVRPERATLLEAEGGTGAASPKQVGQASDTVIVMVFNGQQVLESLQGDDGLAAGMAQGGTVIITSTIEPSEVREAAALLAQKGLRAMDCAVSGGRTTAPTGQLALMVGAAGEDLEAQRDVLETLAHTVQHVGEEPGMGQTAKAALQAFMYTSSIAMLEALALGAGAGIPGDILHDVFRRSAIQAGETGFFRKLVDAVFARDFVDTGSQISVTAKDVGISVAMGHECGAPLFTTGAAHELIKAGFARYPDEDKQSVIKMLEAVTGVTVERQTPMPDFD